MVRWNPLIIAEASHWLPIKWSRRYRHQRFTRQKSSLGVTVFLSRRQQKKPQAEAQRAQGHVSPSALCLASADAWRETIAPSVAPAQMKLQLRRFSSPLNQPRRLQNLISARYIERYSPGACSNYDSIHYTTIYGILWLRDCLLRLALLRDCPLHLPCPDFRRRTLPE